MLKLHYAPCTLNTALIYPRNFLILQGDGTTTSVLFIGELLKYAERYIAEGVHPRIIADGFEIAKNFVVPFLEKFKVPKPEIWKDRELLASVARTSLRTKLLPELADQLTDIVTDAVLIVRKEGEPIDLHMVRNRPVCALRSIDGGSSGQTRAASTLPKTACRPLPLPTSLPPPPSLLAG